jgi:hypothetical protein
MLLAGCKDIDDALHCTMLPTGNFEVGVRILCYAELNIIFFFLIILTKLRVM